MVRNLFVPFIGGVCQSFTTYWVRLPSFSGQSSIRKSQDYFLTFKCEWEADSSYFDLYLQYALIRATS